MKKLKLLGQKTLQTRNSRSFIVYYYLYMNEEKGIYGIRLEQVDSKNRKIREYAEEPGITESLKVAEDLAGYMMKYEVMPISLSETIDLYFDERD